MTESSKPPSWDGQPTTLARHIVNLEEKYAEHVPAQVVSLLETGVMTDRGKIYVYNALHALARMSDSFSTLSTADRLYSLVRTALNPVRPNGANCNRRSSMNSTPFASFGLCQAQRRKPLTSR